MVRFHLKILILMQVEMQMLLRHAEYSNISKIILDQINMKKILMSLMVVIMSLSAFATQTGFVRITLNGENGDTDYASTVVLVKDDARSAAYEQGYDAECLSTTPSGVYGVMFYGFVGTKKCEYIYTNDFEGIEFGFVTNVLETSYTLSFSDFSGDEFILYDRVTNTPITVNASTPDYDFTATAGQTTINDRFVIGLPTPVTGYTVTPNAAGYATFSAAEATVIPDGATAYTGTISGEELVLNQITGGYVPAGTGVIVAGAAGTPYNFAIYAGSVDAIAGNALQATADYETSMKNVYVLKGNAFLEYVGTNALAANKAFIQLSANNAPSRIRMVINGTTAVENVEAEAVKAEKFIENGQVFIRRGNEVYNLQGQIVK